jgi:hypothetical protein
VIIACYILLGTGLLLITALSIAIYTKTKSIQFLVGFFFIYYFSLYGGWSILNYYQFGESPDSNLAYYQVELFRISIDRDYFFALLLYTIFILIIQFTILIFAKPALSVRPLKGEVCIVSHTKLWLIGILALFFSFLIVRDALTQAAVSNASGYSMTRSGEIGALMTIHQLLNRVAFVAIMLGIVVSLSAKENAMYIAAPQRGAALVFHGINLVLALLLLFALGNKNELLYSITAGFLFYIVNESKINKPLLIIGALGGVTILKLIDVTRGTPFSLILELLANLDFGEIIDIFSFVSKSAESFAAHMSMYGVLHFDLPLTWGSSVVSLIASFVPSALWPDRPEDIYVTYAQGIETSSSQGFTIHHATGWYLNFGIVGVPIGAATLGAIWTKLWNRMAIRDNTIFSRFINALLPVFFVASLPSILRAGFEGYKGYLLEGILIPWLVAFWAIKNIYWRAK